MKKVHFLLVTLSILVTAALQAQVQRLALLPSAFQAGEDALSSICVDLFRDAPSGEAYGEIGSSFEKHYIGESPGTVRIKEGAHSSAADYTKFLGTKNEDLPKYYKDFIEKKIKEYENRTDLSAREKRDALQAEVWAFNGLDNFGYIGRSSSDLDYKILQYNQAKKKFSSRYFNDADAESEDIASLLHDMYELRRERMPQLSNVQISSKIVSFSVDGVARRIDLFHDGITATEVSSNSTAIRQGIQKYNQSFHMAPDFAELSPHDNRRYNYLLCVSDEDEYYQMYFNIANGQLTVLPDLNSVYCFLNKR